VPHCIIEYSSDLEDSKLIDSVHIGALNSSLFNERDIKTRSISFANHKTGTTSHSFMHVTARILSGRTLEQRSTLSHCILVELKSLNYSSASLTVEVIEMERDSYAKMVS